MGQSFGQVKIARKNVVTLASCNAASRGRQKVFSRRENPPKILCTNELQVAASIGAAVLENLLCAQCFPVLSTELPKLFEVNQHAEH